MTTSIIIGAGTSVSFGSACVVSAQWGYNPGRQDAYCLGNFDPSVSHTFYRPTQTLSLTVYPGSGISYNCTPSTSCTDADTVIASVSPAGCSGAVSGVDGEWNVQSYSFSKDSKDQPGQESWGLIKYKGSVPSPSTGGSTVLPTTILITSSTGERSGVDSGVTFSSTFASASTGSVSANSVGRASVNEHGIVSGVGGATSDVNYIGNGSASITLTPLYY
jgi:hypothetical protein